MCEEDLRLAEAAEAAASLYADLEDPDLQWGL
jgi:hypothetical protein